MSKFVDFFVKAYNFIRFDIFKITGHELNRTRRFFYSFIKTIVISVRVFISEQLSIKASALTYSILFATIPLIALIISIAKGFGVEKFIENFLLDTFPGQASLIPSVMGFVEKYLESMKGGVFLGIGLIILIGSVMSFFMKIENAFNDIWQVNKSRSIIKQFTTYFSAVLILPVLVVASSGLSIYINTMLSESFFFEILSPLIRFGVKAAPYILNWLVFTFLYLLIPNTRVQFKSALIAGIIAGTAFQLFQWLYINGQINLSRYNVVYGGFAAIPLLLLWLNISCLIVLLGAEISYVLQNIRNFEFEKDAKDITLRYKNFLILYISFVIVKQFEERKSPLSSNEIAAKHTIPIRIVNQILKQLTKSNIIIEVYNNDLKSKTYQPAFDINQLSVRTLFNQIETTGSELFLKSRNHKMDEFWKKTLYLRGQAEAGIDDVLVKDFDDFKIPTNNEILTDNLQ